MADYMSHLPFEIKSNICSHLTDILRHDGHARRQALASLRLTCRNWSDPPTSQLFYSLDVPFWGPRGLRALFALSQRPDLARHVRELQVQACVYEDLTKNFPRCSHEQDGCTKLDLVNNTDVLVPKCQICYFSSNVPVQVNQAVENITRADMTPASSLQPAGARTSLSELCRLIISALPLLTSIHFEVLPPLNSGTNQHHAWESWGDFTSQMFHAVLSGFLSSTSSAILAVSAPSLLFGHSYSFFEAEFVRPPPTYISPLEFEETLLTSPHHLWRVRFHTRQHILSLKDHCTNALSTIAPSQTQISIAHLSSLDIGGSTSGCLPANPPLLRYLFSELDVFPQLTRLVLGHFQVRNPQEIAAFCAAHTPKLTSLCLGGDKTNLARGDWLQVFQHLRDGPVKLARFRLLGTRLHALRAGLWYISPGHDPRPDPMGDSLDFDVLERYVTGKEIPDPWLHASNDPDRRVMVWNAKGDEDEERLG